MLDIKAIVHPTDFSEASAEAFTHALRIALTAKAALTILHVARGDDTAEWDAFPHVRRTLADWGLMRADEPTAAIQAKLGVTVRKVEMEPRATVDAILHFLKAHPADLMVLATEGRQGVARWLRGSVAEALAREAKALALFVPAKANGFVDPRRGEVRLRRVLIPVDRRPKPDAAVRTIMAFARMMSGVDAEERLLHAGSEAPKLEPHDEPHRWRPVVLYKGDAVDAILDAAKDWSADLIGMPTAGHQGFLDALRGSTTERVLRQAPCPLLTVPAAH